jgi:hypothetical protein
VQELRRNAEDFDDRTKIPNRKSENKMRKLDWADDTYEKRRPGKDNEKNGWECRAGSEA